MFHGGTSFGWMNGANSNGKNYEPDVTSYDYDAALDESGHPTPKYFLFRDVIARATGITPPPVPSRRRPQQPSRPSPSRSRRVALGQPAPRPSIPISHAPWNRSTSPTATSSTALPSTVPSAATSPSVRSTTTPRSTSTANSSAPSIAASNQTSLPLHIEEPHARLDILLENTGRVNFGPALPGERVGLLSGVTLAGNRLPAGTPTRCPCSPPSTRLLRHSPAPAPASTAQRFTIDHPADTFLDTSELGKGEVWINGRPLGRFWNVGPQKALYLPAPWLRSGSNDVVVFDMEGRPGRQLRGLDHPILNAPVAN